MASVRGRGSVAHLSFAALVGAFAALLHCCAADQISVGDGGWTLGQNYTAWAGNHTFTVGDSLFFQYNKTNHSVLQMPDNTTYQNCNLTSPNILSYLDGNTTVNLTKNGTYWFVCGVGTHCKQGMKVTIDVSPSHAVALQAGIFMALGAVVAGFIFALI